MRRRRGYVLVMVLALLVLSSTLLVAVSRAAGRAALAARAAEEDLQRRWGVASCRKAVLPYSGQILSALEQERHSPTPKFVTTVRLGGQSFEMQLADEQAKANVNTILENSGANRAENRIRQALSGSGLSNRIKVRPTNGPLISAAATAQATQRAAGLAVGSWGQVFDGVLPAQLLRPMPGSRLAPLDLLTCWGNGAINVTRTTDVALKLAANNTITGAQVGRLIDARDKLFEKRPASGVSDHNPTEQLKELMNQAAGESLKNKGTLGLTQRSTCYSMWVISRTGRRDGYDLFVYDESDDRKPVTWSFSW